MTVISGARRCIAAATVTVLTAALLGAAVSAPAGADTDPPEGTPPTVSADALPTWQVDGVVWSMATVGTTVYATGRFTKARPPGTKAGDAQEVTRQNLLAFDLTTGNLITSFNHALNGQGLRVVASPDGKRVYVGGEFTTVDGQARGRIAAFDTATGALDPNFKPTVSAKVRGIAATNSTVYFGGNFFNVNGKSRTRLAAVKAADGTNIDTWKPTADDDEVMALAMAPGNGRVIVGGKFQKLNATAKVGIGAIDATSGALAPWSSRPVPTRQGSNLSYVTDLFVDGDTVFGSANGEGGHWYDGRFAAKAVDGALTWLDNCYGASYGIFAQNQSVYSVSHAHDCGSLGAFPETSPTTWHRALAETSYATGTDQAAPGSNSNYNGQPVPSLLHWFPTLAMGSFTGQYQAAWAVTGNSDYITMGGEFPSVNGKAQQGLVRFALKDRAPNKVGPQASELGTPTAQALAGGVRVGWQATWDMDNHAVTYEVLRDGGTTPVGTVKRESTFWQKPKVAFVDTTAQPGSSHTYRVRAKDSAGNAVTSAASNAASPGAGSTGPYVAEVNGDGADGLWRLGEAGGTTSHDYAGANDLTVGSGVTRGQAGAIKNDTDHATTFNGTAAGTAASGSAPTPRDFSVEGWVKTTSTAGGKIIGFGGSASGSSSSYDRHLYLTNDGRAVFGVYPGATKVIQSDAGLNDGQWHHIVGTLSGQDGMKLYVDGKQAAADAEVKNAQSYTGFWRIGGDNLSGWPNRPGSDHLNGTLDEIAVYPKALSGTEVARHHGVGTGATTPNQPPTAAFTPSCSWSTCTFDASASADPDGSIASYAWDFGDGKTGTGAKPAHTYTATGTYTVKLTVTDNTGAAEETARAVEIQSQTFAADTFTRKITAGWGSADNGGAWTALGDGKALAVGGANASIDSGGAKASRAAHLNGVSSAGTDLTVKVALNKITTGSGVAVYAVGRKVAGAGEYRVRARLMPAGAIGLQFSRIDAAGTETMIGAEKKLSGVTYKAGAGMWLRMEVSGTSPTTLRAKMWPNNGTAQPAWQVSATDATAALQKAGAIGVRTYVAANVTNAPMTVWVDDLKALRLTE